MLSRSLFVLLICLSSARVFAQESPWGLLVNWPSSVVVNSNITYRIIVTNGGTLFLNNVFVTNAFSRPVQFVESTTTDVTRTVNPNNVTFNIGRQIDPGQTFSITLTVLASSAGPLTNNLTGDSTGTTVRPTGLAVTQVTAPVARSDLTVAITGPGTTSTIFVNDWVPYTITVSKTGSDAVSGVFLTNVLPTGAIVQGYSPSNGVILSGQRVIFDLGTMSLASTQVNLTIQPTGTNVVLAAIVGTTGLETNSANNSATNTLIAAVPVVGELTAEAITDQVFNRQNALFEQLIRVTYSGTSSVPSARVILSNFNYKVVNAVGTNDGNAFVVHAGTLSTNQPTVDLVLEYFFRDRQAKPDPDLIAHSAGMIDLTPPTGTNVAVTNILLSANDLAADRVLLQFPATPGARYAITYMTNMSSPARKAMPLLVAQANYVHWIDYGPPKTISRPFFGELYTTNTSLMTNAMDTNMVTTNIVITTNLSSRFYQAIQLP